MAKKKTPPPPLAASDTPSVFATDEDLTTLSAWRVSSSTTPSNHRPLITRIDLKPLPHQKLTQQTAEKFHQSWCAIVDEILRTASYAMSDDDIKHTLANLERLLQDLKALAPEPASDEPATASSD